MGGIALGVGREWWKIVWVYVNGDMQEKSEEIKELMEENEEISLIIG